MLSQSKESKNSASGLMTTRLRYYRRVHNATTIGSSCSFVCLFACLRSFLYLCVCCCCNILSERERERKAKERRGEMAGWEVEAHQLTYFMNKRREATTTTTRKRAPPLLFKRRARARERKLNRNKKESFVRKNSCFLLDAFATRVLLLLCALVR